MTIFTHKAFSLYSYHEKGSSYDQDSIKVITVLESPIRPELRQLLSGRGEIGSYSYEFPEQEEKDDDQR